MAHEPTLLVTRRAGPSRLGDAPLRSSSSTGTTSEGAAQAAGGRERILYWRRKRRVLTYVAEAWDFANAGTSLLEQRAVQDQTRRQYKAELDR